MNATKPEAASERGGNSPVEEGSSSTAHGDRPAQDQRGEDGDGKTGFDANAAQTPEVEARIYRRRRAMLQAFMIVGRAMMFNVARAFNLSTRGKITTKGKGKASTGGARASHFRKKQSRSTKRAAYLRRLVPMKRPAKAPPPTMPEPERPQGGASAPRGKPQPS